MSSPSVSGLAALTEPRRELFKLAADSSG